jgi:hypothetical protein
MKIDDINKILALEYKKDVRVISLITRHPFSFIRNVMSNPNDDRPVHLMYFGKFAQKNTRNKKDYYKRLKLAALMNYI